MRIIFMGAPEFAVPTISEIFNRGHNVVAVYTRAPTPGGRRGLVTTKTPVHVAAESLGIPVFTPPTLRDAETQTVFRDHAADIAVVVAYGLLLPAPILEAPKFGCVNLHASLLPRWRGAAPIQRAIIAGDKETGVDLMQMDAGLDTGPVAMRETIPIRAEDTAGDLTRRLAFIAARLAASALSEMESGRLEFREQSKDRASYARKIETSEAELDWTQNAEDVRNRIHGLSPAPGAFSNLSIGGRQERIKIFRAEAIAANGAPPGTILDDDMTVACGTGAVRILLGQRSGRTAISGPELMRGAKVVPGAAFTQPAALSSSSRA
jgi:methionyl-tRNA formyltransferase